jgi:hypothetical protein
LANLGWALTGLEGDSIQVKAENAEIANKYQTVGIKLDNVKDLHIYHIEFRSFKVLENEASYIQLRKNEVANWGAIRTVIREIEKFLEKYYITSIFADGKRIIAASTSMKRISARMIVDCFVGKQEDKMKIKSIRNIAQADIKLKMSALVINTVVRMHILRKEYLKAQKRKQNEFKIVNWISSRLLKKKFKETMERKKIDK